MSIFLATAGLVIALSLSTVSCFYLKASSVYKNYMYDEVRNFALLASNLIDPEQHQKLNKPELEGSDLYLEALEPLVQFHLKIPNIHYLYTMVDLNGQDHFILDTAYAPIIRERADVEFSALMEPFEEPLNDSEEKGFLYSGEAYVHKAPYTDEYGTFINALAPINDEHGNMVAFIGVDYRIDSYQQRLSQLRAAASLSLLFGLALALGLGYIAKCQHAQLREAFAEKESREVELNLARNKAETANKAKSDIMALVAHELKTPINAIIGFCQLARDFVSQECQGRIKRARGRFGFNQRSRPDPRDAHQATPTLRGTRCQRH